MLPSPRHLAPASMAPRSRAILWGGLLALALTLLALLVLAPSVGNGLSGLVPIKLQLQLQQMPPGILSPPPEQAGQGGQVAGSADESKQQAAPASNARADTQLMTAGNDAKSLHQLAEDNVPPTILNHAARPAPAAAAPAPAAAAPAPAAAAPAPAAAAPRPPPTAGTQLPPGFRFNKVLAVVAFDRFHYFRQTIEALLQAWGSEQYLLTISIDGPPAPTASGNGSSSNGGSSGGSTPPQRSFDRAGWQAIKQYSQHLQWLASNGHSGSTFREVLINASATNLGLWPNKKRAVAGAMALSDFAVILEDDIVLAPDALRWFEWHVTSGLIFARPELATATCWSASFPALSTAVEGYDLLATHTLGLLDKWALNPWATPWGWAIWQRTWAAVGANWTGQDLDLAQRVLARPGGGWETMPLVSRCNNIGSIGVHMGADDGSVPHIQQRSVTSASFAGSSDLDRCTYTEVPRRNASQLLVYEDFYSVVRQGILPDDRFSNVSLRVLHMRMKSFVRQHQWPAQSSC